MNKYQSYLTKDYSPTTENTVTTRRRDYSRSSDRPDYTKGASAWQRKPSRYSTYLGKEYAGGQQQAGQAARDARGRSQYDIAKERIRSEAEKERVRKTEDLQRKLAAAGATDSGMAFKQQRELEKDIERGAAGQSEAVTAEELATQEARDEAARERQFAREERLGEQAFIGEEKDIQREFESSEHGRNLIDSAWKFESKQDWDTWATERGIDADDANRAWTSVENDRKYGMDVGRILTQAIANLAGKEFEEGAVERKEQRTARTNYYYNLGKTSDPTGQRALSSAALGNLKRNDPVAYYAFVGGETGKKLEDVQADIANTEKVQDAILASAVDPEAMASLLPAIKRLFPDINLSGFEGSPSSEGGEGVVPGSGALINPGSYEYKSLVQNSPVYTAQVQFHTGSGENKWEFAGGLPATGEYFSYKGKLYKRTEDPVGYDENSGPYQDTDYFMVTDVETGETKRIDAKYYAHKDFGGSGFEG